MDPTSLGVITRFELRKLASSAPGVLFLFFFIFFYLWLATKMAGWGEAIAALEQGSQQAVGNDAALMLLTQNVVFAMLSWLLDLTPAELSTMIASRPPALLVLFAITLFVTPVMTLVLGIDQTGSDISRRHIRYLVVRADRGALYLGKTLAVALFWGGALALALGVVFAVVASAGVLGTATVGSALAYLLRIYVTCFLFGLPFIALAGAFAALTGHAVVGAVATFGLWLAVAIISWALGMRSEALGRIDLLFPTALKYRQMSEDLGQVGLAVGYGLAYAAIAFTLGLTAFRKRDL